MTVNERVKLVRKDKNLTMDKFGEKLGVKKSNISLIESGKNGVTEQMAKAICREYNVDYFWLTTGEGDMYVKADMDDYAVIEKILANESEFARNIFRACANLSAEDWAKIEHVAKNISKYMQGLEVDGNEKE